jgi:phage protein U
MYLQLGDIRFEALLGFESFTDTVEATYAVHELINRKPRLQRTGDTLREFSGTINFHSSFCSPEEEYGKLESKRVSGEFLPLIYGNGTYEGDFIIKSISRSPNQTDRNGNYVSLTCNITLVESEGGSTVSQRQEQAKSSAFALTANRPLPVNSNVNNAVNPALAVMNENKDASQNTKKFLDQVETVDKQIERIYDPISIPIAQAQKFTEMAPSLTAKLNRHMNNVQRSLNELTNLLGANSGLETVSPGITAQVNASKGVLMIVQSGISELASLPSVSSLPDALYVLNVQKNSVTLGRQLSEEMAKLNTASSGVAAAVAAKIKI